MLYLPASNFVVLWWNRSLQPQGMAATNIPRFSFVRSSMDTLCRALEQRPHRWFQPDSRVLVIDECNACRDKYGVHYERLLSPSSRAAGYLRESGRGLKRTVRFVELDRGSSPSVPSCQTVGGILASLIWQRQDLTFPGTLVQCHQYDCCHLDFRSLSTRSLAT